MFLIAPTFPTNSLAKLQLECIALPKGALSNTLCTTPARPTHFILDRRSIYKNYMLKLLCTLLVGCEHGVLTNFDFAERDHLSTGFGSDSATFRSSLSWTTGGNVMTDVVTLNGYDRGSGSVDWRVFAV